MDIYEQTILRIFQNYQLLCVHANDLNWYLYNKDLIVTVYQMLSFSIKFDLYKQILLISSNHFSL